MIVQMEEDRPYLPGAVLDDEDDKLEGPLTFAQWLKVNRTDQGRLVQLDYVDIVLVDTFLRTSPTYFSLLLSKTYLYQISSFASQQSCSLAFLLQNCSTFTPPPPPRVYSLFLFVWSFKLFSS